MIDNRPDEPVVVGDGVTATWEVPLAKAYGLPDAIEIVLMLAKDVGADLAALVIAHWIFAKFGEKAASVQLKRKPANLRIKLTSLKEYEDGGLVRELAETIIEYRK